MLTRTRMQLAPVTSLKSKERQEDRPLLSLPMDKKFHAACARHFKPATMRRMDRPQENAIATSAPQNRSHGSRIETQSAYGSAGAARLALNLRGRDLNSEDVV